MSIPILKIWNEETQQYEGVPAIRGEDGKQGERGADGYTPVRGVDYWTDTDVAEIVRATVAATLKVIAPYSIEFNKGKLYAPASASYSPTSVSENGIVFQYKGASGVEELVYPITGLSAGRTYTLDFDVTYNGNYISASYRFGCGIMQKATHDSTTFPTSAAIPSYVTWHTDKTGTQSGKITFTAQSDIVYWVWTLGRLSDGVNVTISMNGRVY